MSDIPGTTYLTRPGVAVRFSVSERTVARWAADSSLSFPRSLLINGRHLYKLAELETWEQARAASQMEAA